MTDTLTHGFPVDPETMRRMGDHEKSIAYWATQEVWWNGKRRTVLAPERSMRVNEMTEDGS